MADLAAGMTHPLLLAAGQLGRGVVGPALQPHFGQGGPRLSQPLGARPAAIEQRQLDILQGGGAGQQVVALEDEAQVPAP
jgi:hypothetical protein